MFRVYQCRTGVYKGMYHVRLWMNGKYFHIGRYRTKAEVEKVRKELA